MVLIELYKGILMGIELAFAAPQHAKSWHKLWAQYLDFYGTSREQSVADTTWARILDPMQKMYSILAFKNGDAIGLTNFVYHPTFWDINDRCYLNDLFVSPDVRGTGAGAALIEATRQHASEAGAPCVYWTTAEDNTTARHLYDKVSDKTPFIKYEIPL